MIIHPDQVLAALKQKAKRSNKVANLDAIHAVCTEVYKSGGVDYSYALVGRMSERQGGPAVNTLYTHASADYRALIDAWGAYAKVNGRRTAVKPMLATDEDLLKKVDDPAVRALLSMAVAERNRYRQQLDTLRSQSSITIDLRPLPGIANVDHKTGEIIQLISPLEGLTEADIDALERAVSPALFKAEGWTEVENGSVAKSSGQRLYGPGYTHALRRLIDAARSANGAKRDNKSTETRSTNSNAVDT